jgi:hypothetical protein
MRVCRCCGIEKPLDSYPKDKRWRGTYKLDCKICFNSKRRANYNPEQRRDEGLRQLYGIDRDTLSSMYTDQDGCCAICGTGISLISGKTKKGKAHVDHCHVTNKVRGLLCTKCNTLLGMAEDSRVILENAIIYLDRSQDD